MTPRDGPGSDEAREPRPVPFARFAEVQLDASRTLVAGKTGQAVLDGGLPSPTSPLGRAIAEVHRSVATNTRSTSVIAVDHERDRRWIVSGELASEEPWRTHVRIVEVTDAVRDDRASFWGHFTHELRNLGFAADSLLERALDPAPSEEETVELMHHVKVALHRLALLSTRTVEFPLPVPSTLPDSSITTRAGVVTRRAVERLESNFDPELLVIERAKDDELAGDVESLGEALFDVLRTAMVRCEPGTPILLEVETSEIGGAPWVTWSVECQLALPTPLDVATFWSPFQGYRRHGTAFELSRARAIFDAHAGTVGVSLEEDSLRMTLAVPCGGVGPAAPPVGGLELD